MEQEKIGKFILKLRKEKALTQQQLASKLGITDRAISKWENGINLPDASLMLELSKIFDISVNELLSGEKFDKNIYINKAEDNLIKLNKKIENLNRSKIILAIIFDIISFIALLGLLIQIISDDGLKNLFYIIFFGLISLISIFTYSDILLKTGYYKCRKCGYTYMPNESFFSFKCGIFLNRYLKCPKCNKRSLHKKVIKKIKI